jgi:hypothetical protein
MIPPSGCGEIAVFVCATLLCVFAIAAKPMQTAITLLSVCPSSTVHRACSMLIVVSVLHPYYKLNYIRLAWGGEAEQQAEIKAGHDNAKNWQKEAEAIVESVVHLWLI